MTRRKREIVGLPNERDFRHLVELAPPPGGFRSTFLEFDAFHRERRRPHPVDTLLSSLDSQNFKPRARCGAFSLEDTRHATGRPSFVFQETLKSLTDSRGTFR